MQWIAVAAQPVSTAETNGNAWDVLASFHGQPVPQKAEECVCVSASLMLLSIAALISANKKALLTVLLRVISRQGLFLLCSMVSASAAWALAYFPFSSQQA